MNENNYFAEYQNQYDEINASWTKFWNNKKILFLELIAKSEIPKRNRTIFFDDKNRIEFDKKSKLLITNLRNKTENWRNETKKLKSTIEFKCRNCNQVNNVKIKSTGPGNKRTYGGDNLNTCTSREFLLKPEYGRKLVQGRQYFWRNLFSFNQDCKKCNKNIFSEKGSDIQLIFGNEKNFKNGDKCAIYLFDEKDSWHQYCGVWMTMFEWYSYELKGNTEVNGYDFFIDYQENYRNK